MRRPVLNHSDPGQAVYEPLLGSGTTLIAAQSIGRVCYGIEIDPPLRRRFNSRSQAFTGEKATRLLDGQSFDAIELQNDASRIAPEVLPTETTAT